MATRRLLYAGAALLSFICWAQNLSDSFIDPSGPDLSAEKNYTIGQIIKLQWSTSYDNISLCLIQYDHDEDCELLEDQVRNVGSYVWTVNTTKDYMGNPRFHFELFNGNNDNESFWSPGFFISPPAVPATSPTTSTTATSSISSTSSTDRSSTSNTLPPLANISPMPSPANKSESHDSSGLSTGAKAGIGVGVPMGFLAGCALMLLVLRRRTRTTQPSSSPHGEVATPLNTDQKFHDQDTVPYQPGMYDPPPVTHELPVQRDPHEAP